MFKILLAVICTEAVVEVLQSRIFDFVRDRWEEQTLRGYFARCGFCQSVWVGAFFSYVFWVSLGLELGILEPLLLTPVVFRCSNVLHGIVNFVRGLGEVAMEKVFAFVLTLDEAKRGEDEIPED